MTHVDEGERQQQREQHQQVDPRRSELFQSDDVMARPYSGYSLEDEDRERCRRSTSNSSFENLVGQQMSLIREMFQMVNSQNAHMRDQINIRNRYNVVPEKFAGTSSFHSFMVQFENCCELNHWEEHEKFWMLKNSLTGDAAAILWDFGSDRQRSYSELVKRLKARYGFEGQSESFRLQLRMRRQQYGETLSYLEQDIRKLITLGYPGETSIILESIARDAFIAALSDRDLALQVLAQGPETLEEAYQTATRLKSYKDLIYANEQHSSVPSKIDIEICAIRKKEETDSELRQMKDEMKEMVQAIQEIVDVMTRFSEDIEQIKYQLEERSIDVHTSRHEDCHADKARPYANTIVCFRCNQKGHKRFKCPEKNRDHTSDQRKRRKSGLLNNSKKEVKTRAVKIPPQSEVSVALEEFLDSFETLFGGEGDDEHKVIPEKVLAHRVSDPSALGSSHTETMLGRECGAFSDLVLGSSKDPDTVSSDRYYRTEARRTVHEQSSVDKEIEMCNRNSNTFNDKRPRGGFKRLGKFNDSVSICSSLSRCKKLNQKAWRMQAPIPRPCVHCSMVIGSRALMRRHIQAVHQDLLLTARNSRQDSERKVVSIDEDEIDARPPESVRPTRDVPNDHPAELTFSSRGRPPESAKPTQNKVRFAELLETMEMYAQPEMEPREVEEDVR